MDVRNERVKTDGVGVAIAFPYIAGIYAYQCRLSYFCSYILSIPIVGAVEEK